jgi:hypothetical protein
VADTQTIGRIGEMLKNIYKDGVVEIQNQSAVIRKKFKKAKAVRVSGDHYEGDVRIGGNRGAVGARLSDDPMPVAKRQKHKKWKVFDRSVFATIKLYDKDIENADQNADAFVNHLDDEMENAVKDFMKHMNIITYGDGTGTIGTINAGTVASNTFVGKTGTAYGNFGSRYLMTDDQLDIYSSDFTVKRTPAGGVSVVSVDPSTRTVVVDQNLTLTGGDVIVRYNSANKEYIGLWLASDNSSSVVFQNVDRGLVPLYRGNVIDAGGNPFSEVYFQQMFSLIEIQTGETPDFIVTHNAQYDKYSAIGTALKRFMTNKMDMGFQSVDYLGVEVTKDVDCPPMAAFVWKDGAVQNGVTKPLGWLDRDGSVLKWVSGYAAWTAILAEYGNYVYPVPGQLGRIQGLQVDTTYLR